MPTRRTLLSGIALSTVPLAGCLGGGDPGSGDATTTTAQTTTDSTTTTAQTTTTTTDSTTRPTDDGMDTPTVVVSSTELGDVLTDNEGNTLYLFTRDEDGESVCYDGCEQNWPPLTVDSEPVAGDGVTADLGTHERQDGSLQVTADDWPLYYYAGDSAPGDTTGQGVGDVWFVLRPDGSVVRPQADVVVTTSEEFGDILTDSEGNTLYLFTRDGDGQSVCYDGCAQNWPPLTVEDAPTGGDGVTAELGTHERRDGVRQVTAAGWPLYYFAGDSSPGDTTGQGVGDVWFVLGPDGSAKGMETETTTTTTESNNDDGGGIDY